MYYPKVNRTSAIVIFIANIIWPGSGTIAAGIIDLNGCNTHLVLIGILQLILACIIIGWIWSIVWGYKLLKHVAENKRTSAAKPSRPKKKTSQKPSSPPKAYTSATAADAPKPGGQQYQAAPTASHGVPAGYPVYPADSVSAPPPPPPINPETAPPGYPVDLPGSVPPQSSYPTTFPEGTLPGYQPPTN